MKHTKLDNMGIMMKKAFVELSNSVLLILVKKNLSDSYKNELL